MADELLKALGQLQRAEHTGRTDAPPDPYGPLDEAEQASILAAVLGEGEPRKAEPAPADATVVPLAPARRRRAWLAGVGSLAAAAGLMIVLRAGDPELLPEYAITRASGEASSRGQEPAPAAPLRVQADTTIDWVVAPARPVRGGGVGVRLIAEQGEQRRWIAVDGVQAISEDGVVRLRGRAGELLGLPPGPWTLIFVIARPDLLPGDLEAFARGREQPARHGWQLEPMQVQVDG